MTTVTSQHPTYCCGMGYIYGFGPTAQTINLQQLDRQLKEWPTGRTLEATLTDAQMMQWAPELRKRGFKLVHRFRNSNSGNYVSVLLFCKSRARKPRPFSWEDKPTEFTKKKEETK